MATRNGDLEHVRDKRLPLWLRVVHLARAHVGSNGHAPMHDIVQQLEAVDIRTGELSTPVPTEVDKAIRTAKSYGYLLQGSGRRCLIPRPEDATYGRGDPDTPCLVHSK